MTTILFDSTKVKSGRKSFAAGIAPARPARFVPSDEDRRWWAENATYNHLGYEVVGPSDAELEQAAGCALAQARLDSGAYGSY